LAREKSLFCLLPRLAKSILPRPNFDSRVSELAAQAYLRNMWRRAFLLNGDVFLKRRRRTDLQ
jgi:hypothetical protein